MRVSGEEKLPSTRRFHDQGGAAGLTEAYHGQKGTEVGFARSHLGHPFSRDKRSSSLLGARAQAPSRGGFLGGPCVFDAPLVPPEILNTIWTRDPTFSCGTREAENYVAGPAPSISEFLAFLAVSPADA